MKKINLLLTLCVLIWGISAFASPVPEVRTCYVYWEVPGAPSTIIWDSTNGLPYVFHGYLVGYATRYDGSLSTSGTKIFHASFDDYAYALEYLYSLPNPVLTPTPALAE